ncbi:MAG: hypothetical protein IPK70_14725 [Flavobacteriales bacterium]|nr:hypothetical protein [Flavobacteriales bacterium]
MILNIDTLRPITDIPYRQDFDRWRGRLSDAQYDAIMVALNERFDGTDIQTSSWIPGSDWMGTVYEPIYTTACLRDFNESALCFGLFVWVAVQNREDEWGFGRYKLKDIPISGLTYFRVHR